MVQWQARRVSMCRKVMCLGCALPTWEGCGQHIEAVLGDVPPAERCAAWGLPGATCGFVRLRVPNDGNCLYYAIDVLSNSGAVLEDASPRLRQACAAAIASAPASYPAEVLGAAPEAYTASLLTDATYGGELELNLLSAHLGLGLCVVDLTPRPPHPACLHVYNAAAPKRAFLLYTGTHYDALLRGTSYVLEGTPEALDAHGAAALALGECLRAKGEGAPRPVKRVCCSGCQAVMEESLFGAHVTSVEHGDDFDFMCVAVE